MEPLAVHHVAVNVDDAEKGIAFYTDVLGGTLRDDRPDFGIGGAWVQFGVTQVHLIELAAPPKMGQHFAVLVADIDDAVRELRGKGLAVDDPKVVGTDLQTFVEDPFGNAIEIHQVGTTRS
jgi:catechol 2,3-dioxygenase-like lactoylglutathione lyase family enzyme